MDKPKVAARNPFPVEVTAGKTYQWCACGQSKQQPFCDGSHQGTDFRPIPFTAPRDKIVFFCGCKQSGSAPLCDGSHSHLQEE